MMEAIYKYNALRQRVSKLLIQVIRLNHSLESLALMEMKISNTLKQNQLFLKKTLTV